MNKKSNNKKIVTIVMAVLMVLWTVGFFLSLILSVKTCNTAKAESVSQFVTIPIDIQVRSYLEDENMDAENVYVNVESKKYQFSFDIDVNGDLLTKPHVSGNFYVPQRSRVDFRDDSDYYYISTGSNIFLTENYNLGSADYNLPEFLYANTGYVYSIAGTPIYLYKKSTLEIYQSLASVDASSVYGSTTLVRLSCSQTPLNVFDLYRVVRTYETTDNLCTETIIYYDTNDNFLKIYTEYYTFYQEDYSYTRYLVSTFSNDYQAGYDSGYTVGYEDGTSTGITLGYDDGYKSGYSSGYGAGKNAGLSMTSENYNFLSLISAVIDAPIQAITGLFNFDLLGFNMASFLYALITCCIIVAVVKLILAR